MTATSSPQPQEHARRVKTPVGDSFEVSVQFFLDRILPPLRHNLSAVEVIQTLKSTGRSSSHKPITLQNRWRGFSEDPASSDHAADCTFKPLEGAVKAIIKASGLSRRDVEPTLSFQNNSTCVTAFRERTADTFPDAVFLYGSERTWATTAVLGEYKMNALKSDVHDNIAKITSSMVNCMQHDPRRRFVLGFTIENSDMKLWFCDRSQILVSKPFNFIKDHQYFVHFSLSILYAEASELGWDPTMLPLHDGSNFDITIRSNEGQSRVYRTLKLLSDSSARTLLSKGTRVWKAVRIEDGEMSGEAVALKDFWAEPGRTPEAIITEVVRDAAINEDTEIFVDRLFPKVDWHGDVFVGGEGMVLDCTRSLTTKGQTPDCDSTDKSNITDSQARKRSAATGLVHCRIVFAPACQRPIHQETSVVTIFHALAGAAYALQLMHDAGWVHRDVSTGNVVVDEDGNARLVDFEYAKMMKEDGELDIGTAYFMALEVKTKHYWFLPELDYGPAPEVSIDLFREVVLGNISKDQLPEMKSPPIRKHYPFRYNPLHDLESLWWIAAYFLFKREAYSDAGDIPAGGDDAGDNWNIDQQSLYADKLFDARSGERSSVLITGERFYNSTEVLHPIMQEAAEILDGLRKHLVTRFSEVEKDIPSIDHRCADGLHVKFMAAFFKIARTDYLRDIKLRPLSQTRTDLEPPRVPANDSVNEAAIATTNAGAASQRHSHSVQEPTPGADADHEVSDVPLADKPSKIVKATAQRKTAAKASTHRYNLRPRPKRS